MALKVPSDNPEDGSIDAVKGCAEEGIKSDSATKDKLKERRDRNRPPSKIVVRRLPPTMTEAIFRDQVSPIPEHDYLCFVRADLSLGPGAFSRAYINFIHQSDIITFKDQFDGYIFVDMMGNEYSAVVEFAPFQRLPKKNVVRRKDAIAGTIEEDPAYVTFLQTLEEELKDKEIEHTFDYSYQLPEKDDKKVTTTPLLEFLKQRRAERQRSRDERREERRKKERDRDAERRKIREDERRKKKPEKETIVAKHVLHNPAKEQDASTKPARFKDVKSQGDRKRDEEKPPYKDKKYPDSRGNVRDKPGFKANATGRQKATDNRPLRDDRRPAEDFRKKAAPRATDESRKPSNVKSTKYSEKESRFKDRDQHKPGRDPDVKRNVKEEAGRSGEGKVNEEMKLQTAEQDKPSVKLAVSDQLFSTESKKRVGNGARRFSLEGDHPALDSPDIKPFRKSAECLQDKGQEKHVRLTSKEYLAAPQAEKPKAQQKSAIPRERVEKLRRSSLESGGVDVDCAKAASSGARGPMRRNLSLELEKDKRRDETEAEKAERKKTERRIRNKDRPSMEIYRPGMGRFSKQRIDRDKD